jgi:hypothetical protein
VVASAASASNFTSGSATTWVHGNQEPGAQHVFTVNSRTVKCETATFLGEATGTSVASLTITPTYSGCEAFGIKESEGTKVTMNGCDYKFTAASTTSGTVQIECPVGQEITVDVGTGICTVHIPPQTLAAGSIDYTVGGGDVTVNSTAANIKTTMTIGSGGLLLCGTGGERPGSYTGSVTAKGFKNAGLTESTTIGID